MDTPGRRQEAKALEQVAFLLSSDGTLDAKSPLAIGKSHSKKPQLRKNSMQEPDESFPSNSQHALQREEPLSEHGMEASRIPLETPRNVITDKYTDLGSQMRAKAKDHSESQQESAQPVNHRMAEAELRAHLCAAEREYNKCQRLASAKRQGTIGTEHTTPEVAHPNETERKDSSHERYNDFTVERAYDDRISRTSEQGSPLSENELSDIISQGVR